MVKKKRVALVTGCGRAEGLGYEICRQLACQGFSVVLTARDSEKADALACRLEKQGLDVTGCALDITKEQSVSAVAEYVTERFGYLDVLINNATGVDWNPAPSSVADLAKAKEVVDVTLFGTWRITQAVVPLLKKGSEARVVNVSSSSGLHGDKDVGLISNTTKVGPAYGIAKAALNALTSTFAAELSSLGIKVNAVCPGFTATYEGTEALGARSAEDSAKGVIWAATLDKDGPTGGFFSDKVQRQW